MARLGRYFIAGQPLHVIQRGNDRRPVFFADEDYAQYRQWLIAASQDHGLSVHAHVLMPNHVHLLVTPERAESLPKTMQSLGRRYVRYVNARHRRTGTLWEGRYRAAPVDSEEYLIGCCSYIELNPFARAWWRIRASTAGRATARMPRAAATRWPVSTTRFAGWAAASRTGRRPIAR
jgi:putative transposase